ncbi:MAG: hypothetical protein ACXV8O_00940 [Methylobacter sp.]
MSKLTASKKLVLCLQATVAMIVVSQGVLAHTRLETPTVLENTKVHNRINIGHGCTSTPTNKATIGTSVVFPNAISYTPVIGVDSGSGKVYTSNPASTYLTTLAGIGTLIRTGGPWTDAAIKADALGNIDGFWAGGKAYDQDISTPIQVDFNSAAVKINPTSCARSVTFMLAVADFCSVSVPSATAVDAQVLYWSPIPNFTGVPGQPFGTPAGSTTNTNLSAAGVPVGPAYSNYDGYSDSAHQLPGDGWGSPATLKVVRNTTGTPATLTSGAVAANPLPAGCTGNGGLGDDVYVYPSAAQINAELPVWSGTKQNGTNIWK